MGIRVAIAASLFLLSPPLAAQTLRDQVNRLFTFGDCGEPMCLPVNPTFHGLHYIPSAVQGNASLISFLTTAIASSTADLPVSGTSGGATFAFIDGLPVQTAVSAGPIFAERAQTLGRGRLLAGAAAHALSFSSLRGVPLDGLVFNFTHENVGDPIMGIPTFENDVIQVDVDMNVNLMVALFSVAYGIMDRADISVAVPFVHASVSGTSRAQIFPFSGLAHLFGSDAAPSLTAASTADGSASGIGDVAIRAKLNLQQRNNVGVAVLADVRLPTGSEEDMLGSGALAVRGLGIVSARYGDFSPHLNAGYVHRSGEHQVSSAVATVGFDHLVMPWATFAVDVLADFQLAENPHPLPADVQIQAPYPRTIRLTTIPERRDHRIGTSVGFKVAASQGLTITANGLIPVNAGGLRPRAMWTLGGEFGF